MRSLLSGVRSVSVVVGVVLDTNVIVSGHLKEAGVEAALLQLVYGGRVRLLVSRPILEEYGDVLRRPKFGFAPERVAEFLERVRTSAVLVEPRVRINVCRDPDDNKFLACALAGHGDAVVTGNKRHFPPREFRGIPILNASEFLARFAVGEALGGT